MIKYRITKDGNVESLRDFRTEEEAREYMKRFTMFEGCEVSPCEVPSMTVKQFIEEYDGDIDVYDDFDESLGIAFCGGDDKLTAEGMKHFEPIMGLDVEVYDDVAIVNVEHLLGDYDPDVDRCPEVFRLVKELFYVFAGHCTEAKYDKYVE